jgi:hypothetical protein
MNRLHILLTVMVVMVVAPLLAAHEVPAQGLTGTTTGGTADATGGTANNTIIVPPGITSTTPTTGPTANAGATATTGEPPETTTGASTVVSPGAPITACDSNPAKCDVLVDTIPAAKAPPETGGLSFVGPAVGLLTLLIGGAARWLLSALQRR